MPPKPIPVNAVTAAKFWPKVDRRGPDECWPWLGQCDPNGYGTLWLGTRKSRVHYFAHRVSAALAGMDLNAAPCVLHSCDNPPCVNPVHLRVGTHAENMADCKARGRVGYVIPAQPKGEAHPRHKLTNADVLAIRDRAGCDSQTVLAMEFGVSQSLISRVVGGKRRTKDV
jgi:hypothetical protein